MKNRCIDCNKITKGFGERCTSCAIKENHHLGFFNNYKEKLMENMITNVQLQEFLQDFQERSETIILEDGKEKNEIIAIAKAKGILLKGSIDLAGFKTVYAFTDRPNLNGAILPKAHLLKALPTLVGKPIDIDHNRRYVVGFYIDYRYVAKKSMVIAYGIFFKNSFATEWKEVAKRFKEKTLATSFEIWSPEADYVKHANGTYDMAEMEVAGGAILFEDDPSFKEAVVLELSKVAEGLYNTDLVFASTKYKCNDILTNIGNLKCVKCGRCKEKGEVKMAEPEIKTKAPKAEENKIESIKVIKPEVVTVSKIKCSNCEDEFTPMDTISGQLKCPKCFAIIDRAGTVLYPPQIMNFKVSCSCRANDWILIKYIDKGEKAHIKCRLCSKQYEIEFTSMAVDEIIKIPTFMYEGETTCRQCQRTLFFNITSDEKTTSIKCDKCGITFEIDISKHCDRRVKNIKELVEPKKASKGETLMDKEKVKKQEKAKVEDTLKDLAAEVIELKAQLETANKKSKRADKILLIAKELKGLLKEKTDIVTLKVLEISSITEQVKTAEGELTEANKQFVEKEKELEKANQTTDFYKKNAVELEKRKTELGKFAKDMNDEQILSDTDFEIASLKKKNSELENTDKVTSIEVASENVGDLTNDQKNNRYKKIQDGVNEVAYGKKKLNKGKV